MFLAKQIQIEWFATLISKNLLADLEYSTTVTFPLATFPDIFHPFFSHFEVGRVGTISFPVLACVSCFVVHISCLWHNVVTLFLKEHPYFRAPQFLKKKVSLIFIFCTYYAIVAFLKIKTVCILVLFFYLTYREKKLIQVSRKNYEIQI